MTFFALTTVAEKAKLVEKISGVLPQMLAIRGRMINGQKDDEPVLVKRRQQNLPGYAYFPYGTNEHAFVLGDCQREMVPDTCFFHRADEVQEGLLCHGEDTLIHGGAIVLVFQSKKTGPIDTKRWLHRVVVRPGIDFGPLVELLDELAENPERYSADQVASELQEEVIAQIKRDFRLYQAEGCDDLAVLLPTDETPDWDALLGWQGKVSDWAPGRNVAGMPSLPENPVLKAVDDWPNWVEERIREECARWPGDAKHVPDNLRLAGDPAIVAVKSEYRESFRYGQVMIVNGRDPNVGFCRVRWNRFWEK